MTGFAERMLTMGRETPADFGSVCVLCKPTSLGVWVRACVHVRAFVRAVCVSADVC